MTGSLLQLYFFRLTYWLKFDRYLTGIFEKHKLMFSFQITIKLEQDKKMVTQDELEFFIKVCFICLSILNMLNLCLSL